MINAKEHSECIFSEISSYSSWLAGLLINFHLSFENNLFWFIWPGLMQLNCLKIGKWKDNNTTGI